MGVLGHSAAVIALKRDESVAQRRANPDQEGLPK